jgi:hypothetical protein
MEEIGVSEVRGEFKVSNWREETYAEREPGKLTRAGGDQEFSGAIQGSGHVEWLMCYREDGTAAYVGMQEIDGTLDGKRGSFVLTAIGAFNGTTSDGQWSIVSESGRGELAGITGNGSFEAGPGPQATFQLEFELG